MKAMGDGSITCPIVVVAGHGDPLFSLDYTQKVFARIAAPVPKNLSFSTPTTTFCSTNVCPSSSDESPSSSHTSMLNSRPRCALRAEARGDLRPYSIRSDASMLTK